jgi:hypothetical protein
VSKPPVPPAAYELTNNPLPFSRGTLYRWEALGLFKLLRVGGKTLISSQTVADLLSGAIRPPANAGRMKRPEPCDRGGHAKRRKAETAPADAAE